MHTSLLVVVYVTQTFIVFLYRYHIGISSVQDNVAALLRHRYLKSALALISPFAPSLLPKFHGMSRYHPHSQLLLAQQVYLDP